MEGRGRERRSALDAPPLEVAGNQQRAQNKAADQSTDMVVEGNLRIHDGEDEVDDEPEEPLANDRRRGPSQHLPPQNDERAKRAEDAEDSPRRADRELAAIHRRKIVRDPR